MTKKPLAAMPPVSPPPDARRTHLMIEVTYDPKHTDPEALANGFGRLWRTVWELASADFQHDYRPVQAGEFTVLADAAYPTCPPPLTFAIPGGDTEAHPPVPVDINVDEYGIVLTPRKGHGQPFGDVILDINEQRIEVLVYEPDDQDDPAASHVLAADLPHTFHERRAEGDDEPPSLPSTVKPSSPTRRTGFASPQP